MLAVTADKKGAQIAFKEQVSYKEEGCSKPYSKIWSSCFSVFNAKGEVTESGKLIRKTSQGLVIYQGYETKIIQLGEGEYLRFSQLDLPEKTDK